MTTTSLGALVSKVTLETLGVDVSNRMTFATGTTASAALCSSQQPRVTCYQARIRMNEPHDLATVLSLIAKGVVFMVPGHKPST